jgi:uncharacterized protein (TIGR03000 family)
MAALLLAGRLRTVCLCLVLFMLLPPLSGQTVPDGKALLTVRLPAQATLTVDDMATEQIGPERTFITPSLAPGHHYFYTLAATWDDKGEAKTLIRKVRVRSGEHTRVDLTQQEVRKDQEPNNKNEAKEEPRKKEEPKIETKKKEEPQAGQAKSRTFLFTYSATVTGLPEGKTARIWLPVPSAGPDQDVTIESTDDLPKGFKISDDKKTNNRYLFVEAKANADGQVPLAIPYKITRREVKGRSKDTTTAQQIARFLQADAMVPIAGKPVDDIKEKLKLPKDLPKDEMAAARLLYDLVNDHMKYGKPQDKAWGRGDSIYAAQECVGNCSDFHSLFITLARSQHIPAKFEIGFPLPAQRGAGEIPGYHCWAKFKVKDGSWVPVDISEANKDPKMKDYYFGNLTEDRVAFSTGRDLELIPKQDGPPVNFLVYPYVEVDGKPYAADKIKRRFTYKDLEK